MDPRTQKENAMRDFLGPVDAVQVQTELGPIYLLPGGKAGVQVNAPHLTVDGMPLQASAFLVSDRQSFNFNFPVGYDVRTERWSTPENALNGRLVDGRMADPIILGKIAQAIVPAVRKFAEENHISRG
jgi:hypothetical protein